MWDWSVDWSERSKGGLHGTMVSLIKDTFVRVLLTVSSVGGEVVINLINEESHRATEK